jgi:hypothetical protein
MREEQEEEEDGVGGKPSDKVIQSYPISSWHMRIGGC